MNVKAVRRQGLVLSLLIDYGLRSRSSLIRCRISRVGVEAVRVSVKVRAPSKVEDVKTAGIFGDHCTSKMSLFS